MSAEQGQSLDAGGWAWYVWVEEVEKVRGELALDEAVVALADQLHALCRAVFLQMLLHDANDLQPPHCWISWWWRPLRWMSWWWGWRW